MFGLLNSVVSLATSAAEIVAAPVKIAVDLADATIKPVAEVAKELADDVAKLKE